MVDEVLNIAFATHICLHELWAIPALPSEWLISGLVYDVASGLVEVVVPAVRIRAAAA